MNGHHDDRLPRPCSIKRLPHPADPSRAAARGNHPQRPQRPHDARRLAGEGGGDEAHGDDEGVEDAPHVGGEGPEPVAVGVDRQLRREERGEDQVQPVHPARHRALCRVRRGRVRSVADAGRGVGIRLRTGGVVAGAGAVAALGAVQVLGLNDGADEVLRGSRRAGRGAEA